MRNLSEVIPDKFAWTKGRAACTNQLRPVPYWADDACMFCLEAGMQRAGRGFELWRLAKAISQLFPNRSKFLTSTIVAFNDHSDTTWEDVASVIALYETWSFRPCV
jgi:hypothetical protein